MKTLQPAIDQLVNEEPAELAMCRRAPLDRAHHDFVETGDRGDDVRACRRPFAARRTQGGGLMLGLVYFLIQVGSYGLNFWAPHLIRTAAPPTRA